MASSEILNSLHRQIEKVETEYSLAQFSPFGVAGVADYFVTIQDTIELAAVVKAAQDVRLPYLVIGQASKTIFSRSGFPGLVIQNLSHSYSLAQDKSQIVVDSGVSLNTLITQTASLGLGGLTSFYGSRGTVGGAVYSNLLSENGQPFLSSVRYLTLVLPPTRLDGEAKIMRFSGEWLRAQNAYFDSPSKLKIEKNGLMDSKAVILTVLLQLTSVRNDEIRRRVQLQNTGKNKLKLFGQKRELGPMFIPILGQDLQVILKGAGITSLKVPNLSVSRSNLNYLVAGRTDPDLLQLRSLIEQIKERVFKVYGIRLVDNFEYIGVW